MSMRERVAQAIHDEALSEHSFDDLREVRLRQADAMLRVLREPTEDMTSHPSFQAGEWSRRNIEAYIDAALNDAPSTVGDSTRARDQI